MFLVSSFFGGKGLDPKKIPQTKAEIEKLLDDPEQTTLTTAVSGYKDYNLTKWLKSTEIYDFNYNVLSSYEPYYVAHRNIQYYDETYVTWGYNKVTQLFDMNTVGYKVKILPDAFMIHLNHNDIKGFKSWNKGFKKEQRHHMKVGTSTNRWLQLPGLLINSYFPPWAERNGSIVMPCEQSSAQRLAVVKDKLKSTKESIHVYKTFCVVLLGVLVGIVLFAIKKNSK